TPIRSPASAFASSSTRPPAWPLPARRCTRPTGTCAPTAPLSAARYRRGTCQRSTTSPASPSFARSRPGSRRSEGMPAEGAPARTLFEKLWSIHLVAEPDSGVGLLHVDRLFIHDLHSEVFEEFARRG